MIAQQTSHPSLIRKREQVVEILQGMCPTIAAVLQHKGRCQVSLSLHSQELESIRFCRRDGLSRNWRTRGRAKSS